MLLRFKGHCVGLCHKVCSRVLLQATLQMGLFRAQDQVAMVGFGLI